MGFIVRGAIPRAGYLRVLTGAAVLALGAVVATVAQAQSTLDRVVKEGKISIGIHNAVPWGFRDEGGQVTGFSPDLVHEAFAPMGVTEIEFVISDFGALIPGLTAGRFDAIASGLYITPERCKAVAFSDPDLSLKDAVLVLAGNPKNINSYKDFVENPDLTIGVGRGSTTVKNVLDAGVPEVQLQQYQDIQSNIAALIAGRIDAAGFSAPTVIGLAADPNLTAVERAVPFEGYVQPNSLERSGYSAIAFRLEDTALRDAYNARLTEMKADGTVAKIMAKYGFTDAEKAPELTQADICAGQS
ncbi:ectoine/hydroxyectoine ABC transporter substrate-binding protein EhuB [Allomesorhizobium camelthorni]|uniref:Ectoine/hydroxyectoine ABC transporter substrate-binding protein EhuB n=1 Tax=Allomesorhizobium camelthorni TaxID=475069 RepID=A0A6G4WI46_9HYPH|nr:ectoine/hydroxyectoine ABC transporter substrate-binding protein EhuB [Mesorhizobium camelthorni]NGO53896.1 ectoine/hydroxyectoine ABC transporter substrate-binding protein EhuB [Mesorhizobium camelthorni]